MHQFAIDQPVNKQIEEAMVSPANIVQMTDDLFVTMLDIPINSTPDQSFAPTANSIEASIQITGTWNAEFRVFAPSELASGIACTMFGLNESEISESDIADAMGEIANMIGGNAKGNVDGDCQLSLPCVGNFKEPACDTTFTVTFECMGHPFMVQLSEFKI